VTEAEQEIARYLCGAKDPCQKHKAQARAAYQIVQKNAPRQREQMAIEALNRLTAKKEAA